MMDFLKVHKYTKDLNILYIEDDEQLLKSTVEVLGDFFNTIDTAINGEDGLEKYQQYYKTNDKFYDLVITDLNMPVMDGETLIKEIKNINTEQTTIVVSAYNESSRLIDLIQNGITNFILKPVSAIQLMDVLYKTCKSISEHHELLEYRNQLESKVTELSLEITTTQRLSVETISNMVESYDDETGTHVKRIENYTALILDSLPITDDCPAELRDMIAFASLLHDVGKLIIPKHILQKPSSLDEDEFNIIKTHAKLGGEILLKANEDFKKQFNKDSYFKVASDIAYYHHEKWDGSGYPKGLKQNDIPKCARIVAIVDVYDALRSKRVYKDGFSHEKSMEIIKNESGKAFDPELVNIFLEINKDFNQIFERI